MPSLVHEVNVPFRKATFGMGCFWACDSLFGATPGVLRTRVGYSGGTTAEPTYKKISVENSESNSAETTNNTHGDHTEVIEIDYDPKKISYEELLRLFWDNHEYGVTTIIKKQYTSLILYHDDEQKKIAESSLKKEEGKYNSKLVTEISAAGAFYPAEDYHQKYRLQEHSWLYEILGLTPTLLQTSHIAARLNGYLVGVGKYENLEEDINKLGLPDNVADFVKTRFRENEGGSLYC